MPSTGSLGRPGAESHTRGCRIKKLPTFSFGENSISVHCRATDTHQTRRFRRWYHRLLLVGGPTTRWGKRIWEYLLESFRRLTEGPEGRKCAMATGACPRGGRSCGRPGGRRRCGKICGTHFAPQCLRQSFKILL